jgi:hypothetical protein
MFIYNYENLYEEFAAESNGNLSVEFNNDEAMFLVKYFEKVTSLRSMSRD